MRHLYPHYPSVNYRVMYLYKYRVLVLGGRESQMQPGWKVFNDCPNNASHGTMPDECDWTVADGKFARWKMQNFTVGQWRFSIINGVSRLIYITHLEFGTIHPIGQY